MKHGGFFNPHKWRYYGDHLLRACLKCGLAQSYSINTRWRDLTYKEFMALLKKAKEWDVRNKQWHKEWLQKQKQIEEDKPLILKAISGALKV